MSSIIDKEIDEIIGRIKPLFSLEELRKSFSMEKFKAKDVYELDSNHEYLSEAEKYLKTGKDVSISNISNLNEAFQNLEKGASLSCQDLYDIKTVLITSQETYDSFHNLNEYYNLNNDALDLNPLFPLYRDINNCIDEDLTVSDNASHKLREIREKERETQRRLSGIMNTYRSRYASYLSSDVIAFKSGEEALPVKISEKGNVRGTIISYSAKGETVYMVPYEAIELRNTLSSLKQDEEIEIGKILADLSKKCERSLSYIKKDYRIIMTFDRFFTSARFGNSYSCSIANRSEKTLSLNSFFHPLLKTEKVVSNSLTLDDKNGLCLLITGPNAGGKSVLIKTVALCVLMDKVGLMIPCHNESSIPYIDDVYFLGGDNQSVLDNLSTFSSHLLGIKEICDSCSKDSLVIIDEVGEGTSPRDGEALGIGILRHFQRVGCMTLLTSHFDGMKFYAADDPNTLTGAMEFDIDGLKPTYRLLLNTTGKSYGILLAKQIGLSKDIVDDAVDYTNSRKDKDTDSLMDKLNEQISINAKKEQELINEKKKLEEVIEKRKAAIAALYEEKNQIHEKAEKKVKRLVDERLQEIDRIWKSEGKKDMSYSQVSEAKGELKKIKDTHDEVDNRKKYETIPTDVKVGDKVIDEDRRVGTILEIKKNECVLDLDGLRIRRKLAGLKKKPITAADYKKNEKKKASDDFTYLDLGPSQGVEINIIGQHTDEAMRNVVSFIDSARIHHLTSVRIIHGAGGFVLKNAVWKYLSNHKEFVKDYRLGNEGEGGLGATVVHLK